MMKNVLSIILSLISSISSMLPANISTIFKKSDALEQLKTTATSALEDLQNNVNFDKTNFPDVENDYTLEVIQVAESINNEFYIYVYQPSKATKDLQATTINLSYAADDETVDYHLYSLTLTSSEGVFDKYRVNDFEVSDEEQRYYKIVSIMRPFDALIDKQPEDGSQTISEIEIPVKKGWVVTTIGGVITYSENKIESIKITDKYTSSIRYYGNDGLVGSSFDDTSDYDSFYVAIKTDVDMDDLISAKVYAEIEKRTTTRGNAIGISWPTNNEYEIHPESEFLLSRNESNNFTTDGYWGTKHSYNLIETVEEFNSNTGKTLSTDNYDWVIRFFSAPYTVDDRTFLSFGKKYITDYLVNSVSIVELTFSKDGNVYTMGVVDNKQSGHDNNENYPDFEKILKIIIIVLVCTVFLACIGLLIFLMLKYPTFGRIVLWLLKNYAIINIWPVLLTILIIEKVKEVKEG